MAASQSQSNVRHKSIKSLQKNQVSKKETDCTVDDLKEIRPSQVGLDEGVLRELLRLGLETEDKIESFFIADDPEIRKAARRIKLERRLKQSQLPKEEEEFVKAPTDTEVQMERSLVRILELLEDSRRNITAVRTCSVKDEIARQDKERKQRDELDKMILEECEKAQQMYDKINSKWKMTSESPDILEVYDLTDERKDECRKLIEEKDMLIANLKVRLKQADRSFNDELSKQDDYMKILEERINDQISVMNDTYRRELQNLQNMVNVEKNEILNERKKQWEKMAGKKEQLELENMVKRYDYLQEYEEQIDSMMIEQHETMRDQKMIMENKLNKLTVEENRYQSAVLISKELLNYNVQVLQKRQDENRVIKGQQKRIVNRLQDLVRKMQQEQKKEIQRLRNEKNSLQERIKNLHANVNTLNVRLKNLAASSNKKYFLLWDYNQGVAEDLIDKLVKADKKFHASLLCVSWHVPSMEFSRKNLPSYVEAKALLKEMKGKSSSNYHWPDNLDKGDTKKLFSLVLDSIENKTEFLIDDTLKVFLEPLNPNSRKLITINSLFDALGMREKSDIEYMSMFFLRYVVCKDCEKAVKEEDDTLEAQMVVENSQPSPEIVSERLRKQFAVANMVVREEFCSRGAILNLVVGDDDLVIRENTQMNPSTLQRKELPDDQALLPILASVSPSKLCETSLNRPSVESSSGGTKSIHERIFCQKPGHNPSINPIHVSKALNDFVSKLNEERRSKQMISLKEILTQKTLTESRLLNDVDVERYWRNFLEVITEKRKLMWKSLLSQMKVHYKTLLRRHSLNEYIRKLKARNQELRNLVSNYLENKECAVQISVADKLPFLVEESEDSLSSGDEDQ